jgi:hypothetical protein
MIRATAALTVSVSNESLMQQMKEARNVTQADPVRWFDPLGRCASCGKSAHGILRGPRNESYGTYCTKCAESRLKKADTHRARTNRIAP